MFSRLNVETECSRQTSGNFEKDESVETFLQLRALQKAAQHPQGTVDTTAGQTGGQSISEQQNGQTLPTLNLNQGGGGFQVYTNAK